MENIALVVLAACVGAMLIFALRSRSRRARGNAPAATVAPVTVDTVTARTAWQRLGADPQAREEAIHRLFDARSGTVEFETQWDFEYSCEHDSGATEQAYSSMSIRLARPLAEMANREREVLRAVYLLHNADLIDADTWRALTFPGIYGGGAASIISCEYREPVKLPFSDDAGAIRFYADAHGAMGEDAERNLLAILNQLAQKPDAPAVVRESLQRVQDAVG
jgi:hypothetical protein